MTSRGPQFRYRLQVKQHPGGKWVTLGTCQKLATLVEIGKDGMKLYGWPYQVLDTETGKVVKAS